MPTGLGSIAVYFRLIWSDSTFFGSCADFFCVCPMCVSTTPFQLSSNPTLTFTWIRRSKRFSVLLDFSSNVCYRGIQDTQCNFLIQMTVTGDNCTSDYACTDVIATITPIFCWPHMHQDYCGKSGLDHFKPDYTGCCINVDHDHACRCPHKNIRYYSTYYYYHYYYRPFQPGPTHRYSSHLRINLSTQRE